MTTLVLFLLLLLIILGIIFIRYTDLAPHVIFWLIVRKTRNDEYKYVTPENSGLSAELEEFYIKNTPVIAWFFPGATDSTASVLMVPNWYQNCEHENNLKTAGILQELGYNVFLPVYHWNMSGKVFQKRYISPKECQRIAIEAYRCFIKRPEVDRRNIAIYSTGVGTIIAAQLVKDYPIKAIVLEDGPVTLWDEVSNFLHYDKNFPYFLTKIALKFVLWPIIWRTRWQSKNAIKNIRACPSFLIATREEPRNNYRQLYSSLYRPKKFWYEHGLHLRGRIRDLWTKEYKMQISSFFGTFLLQQERPEFHFEVTTKRKKGKKFPFEVRIIGIPPILEPIPLQIILFHKDNRLSEYRIWFSGASLKLNHFSNFKPIEISITQFHNVIRFDGDPTGRRLWIKREADTALNTAILNLTEYPLRHLKKTVEKYYFLKSILLLEQENRSLARETLKEIHSNYWREFISKDSDSRSVYSDSIEKVVSDALPPTMTR